MYLLSESRWALVLMFVEVMLMHPHICMCVVSLTNCLTIFDICFFCCFAKNKKHDTNTKRAFKKKKNKHIHTF